MKKTGSRIREGRGRQYLISLHKWRSLAALIASVVTLTATLSAIVGSLLEFAREGMPVEILYRYYTPVANSLTMLAAAFLIPYAVDGIRMKRFTCPKWLAVGHYAGTVATTQTMFVSIGLISQVDPYAAYGGYNLVLHIVCPVLVLVSFFLVESGHFFTWRDSLICLIHPLVYALVYLTEVVLIGEQNGGWPDLYRVMEFVSAGVALLAFTVLAVLISFGIGRLYNHRMNRRRAKLAASWTDDLDPVAIKIEVFGLGRFAGRNEDLSSVHLPADLLLMLAKRYGIKPAELMRAYTHGVLDALADQKDADVRMETGNPSGRAGRDDPEQ